MKRMLLRVLAIVFALSVLGNLIVGKVFIAGIILTAIFSYYGWRLNTANTSKEK